MFRKVRKAFLAKVGNSDPFNVVGMLQLLSPFNGRWLDIVFSSISS
jgi:hypothetical protein